MPAPSKSGKSKGGNSQAQQEGNTQTQRTLQTRSQRAGLQVSPLIKILRHASLDPVVLLSRVSSSMTCLVSEMIFCGVRDANTISSSL